MRKRILTLLAAVSMTFTTAFTAGAPVYGQTVKKTVKTGKKTKLSAKQKKAASDRKAADRVQDLIDRIYVQNETKTTDADCRKARLEWDKLTKAQKKLVDDYDYFGRDTGDAACDNPLNWNHIGKNEILVVSFGTSFNDSREKDIGGVERALSDAYSSRGWSIRRAFTSQIIINHINARDNEKIDNVDKALSRAVSNGVKNLVIQPTHLMHGKEYDELKAEVETYADKFDHIIFSEPLLGEVGTDSSSVNADKEKVAKAVTADAVRTAGFASLDESAKAGTAFVFMGHGTSHQANITYDQMQTQMKELGYKNVFIGTVEGKPADTACKEVIKKVKAAGYSKVVLRPLMVVAGDHANNDMAGSDKDSWKSQFANAFGKKNISTQIAGLGRIPEIESIYKDHLDAALAAEKGFSVNAATGSSISVLSSQVLAAKKALKDGSYKVDFTTDLPSMFYMNTAYKKAKLTVKNGKMTAFVPLASTGIDKLYVGSVSGAKKSGAKYCKRKTVTVKDSDGKKSKVYAFYIPVKQLGKEFTVSIHGKKSGKWYAHQVKISR